MYVVDFSTTWHCLSPLHPQQQLTTKVGDDISLPSSQPLNPSIPSRTMCAGDSRHACGAPCTYIYFYPQTLSAFPHDCLPTLQPGKRSRISARFMAPGHENPRARQRGAPRAGGRSRHPSDGVCTEPLHLEGSPETRGDPSSGAGPSQNGKCSGGGIGRKSRAGRSTVNYFRFGRTRVCITPVSLHRVE